MDWKTEAMMAGQALVAAVLGGFIGWDRQQQGREAGIRTYAAVSLGACVFGLVSEHVPGFGDKGRIAAQIVSGVGFLGAGVILRERGHVTGLTTAATLWATSAVGLAIAFDMYALGVLTALIVFGLLALQKLPGWSRKAGPPRRESASSR